MCLSCLSWQLSGPFGNRNWRYFEGKSKFSDGSKLVDLWVSPLPLLKGGSVIPLFIIGRQWPSLTLTTCRSLLAGVLPLQVPSSSIFMVVLWVILFWQFFIFILGCLRGGGGGGGGAVIA